jgi:hypothetical protein
MPNRRGGFQMRSAGESARRERACVCAREKDGFARAKEALIPTREREPGACGDPKLPHRYFFFLLLLYYVLFYVLHCIYRFIEVCRCRACERTLLCCDLPFLFFPLANCLLSPACSHYLSSSWCRRITYQVWRSMYCIT